MANKYKELLNKVEPSDEVKEKIIADMEASLPQKKQPLPRRKKLAILSSALCTVCLCCVLFLTLNPTFHGGQNTKYYRIDNVFTHEDSGTAVFTKIELTELDGYSDKYLIFSGVFDFDEFTLSRSGAIAKFVRSDNPDEIKLEFQPDLTQLLSEADLHIGSNYGKTNGQVCFVFGLSNASAEMMISYMDTDTPPEKWDLELQIEGLASKKEVPLFIFDLKQLNL